MTAGRIGGGGGLVCWGVVGRGAGVCGGRGEVAALGVGVALGAGLGSGFASGVGSGFASGLGVRRGVLLGFGFGFRAGVALGFGEIGRVRICSRALRNCARFSASVPEGSLDPWETPEGAIPWKSSSAESRGINSRRARTRRTLTKKGIGSRGAGGCGRFLRIFRRKTSGKPDKQLGGNGAQSGSGPLSAYGKGPNCLRFRRDNRAVEE